MSGAILSVFFKVAVFFQPQFVQDRTSPVRRALGSLAHGPEHGTTSRIRYIGFVFSNADASILTVCLRSIYHFYSQVLPRTLSLFFQTASDCEYLSYALLCPGGF